MGLLLSIAAVYGRTLDYPFIEWDDPFYVARNVAVREGLTLTGFRWAFTTTELSNWHPLTWLSLMADVTLFGPNPWGLHATNILLHGLNTLLLLWILFRTTHRWSSSWLVAALFALHPLHVESVAWISERKGLLGAFFGFLAVSAYVEFAQRGGTRRYLVVALFFAASLLSKPIFVTLPMLLLLFDVWPLDRPMRDRRDLRRLIVEKVPLAAMSFGSTLVTFAAQRGGGAMRPGETLAAFDRITNAIVAPAWYLAKMAWPSGLAPLYSHPALPGGTPWQPGVVTAAGALLLGGSATVLILRRRRYLAVGWFWYLISLAPTLGFVQIGFQPYADRYSYVPSVGIFIVCSWFLVDGLQRIALSQTYLRHGARAAVFVGLAALGVASMRQAETWKDSVVLFERVLSISPRDPVAHFKLGNLHRDAGDPDRALWYFEQAISIHPDFMKARMSLGHALLERGRVEDSIPHFLVAARNPYSEGKAHRYLGFAHYSLGQTSEAAGYFREAVRRDSNDARAYNALGKVLEQTGALEEALGAYRKAADLEEEWQAPRVNAARVGALLGR